MKKENATATTSPPSPQITKPYRTAYSTERVRVQLHFPASGRTKQSFKDECDINLIMKRFEKTGILPETQQRVEQYLDASEFDFQASMEYVANAKSMFEQIPAKIRDQFDNNPAKFVEFCENPKNLPELTQMGLATKRPAQATPVATPPPPTQPTPLPVVPSPAPKADPATAPS